MRLVYLDHSATTPVHPRVLEAMQPYFSESFGNPSSIHQFSEKPRRALNLARAEVASLLGCQPEEVIFTSGGTEGDNLAVIGVMEAAGSKNHLITSSIEHKAILEAARYLEKKGVEVTYLPVDRTGMVSPDDLKEALRPETALVSIMMANNEVGVIQDLKKLTAITRNASVLFHTDAVQAFGKVPIPVEELGLDLLTLSGHKIYGPKGVGALYLRRGVKLKPLFHGGHHEGGRRAGTENIPAIVGLGRAAELAAEDMEAEARRLDQLRSWLWEGISSSIEGVHLNGHPTSRLPHVASVSFEGVEGEGILLNLDLKGVAASTGSACTSETLEASHVLSAMAIDPALAQSTLRFSLGRDNTGEDIDYVIGILPAIIRRLRAISPLV